MPFPYPITEPYDGGWLDVGDGHAVHWEVSGNPDGKPAVLLHGGPGSGSSPRHRRVFDPTRYRIVQLDQRNCGRSTPSAGELNVDLSANTTQHLIADIERLRLHLGIERWLVWGGSWGTTLALAYAEAHPGAVQELILVSVVTTTGAEVNWVTRTMGRLFPERWERFRESAGDVEPGGDLALAYNRLLMDPDPAVHQPAAMAWCDWEDTHVSLIHGYEPDLRNEDPAFRLCFSRLVTHYWANAGFLDDGELMARTERLADIPIFLLHGRQDVSGPVDIAVELARRLPHADLFIAETAGHGGDILWDATAAITDRLVENDDGRPNGRPSIRKR